MNSPGCSVITVLIGEWEAVIILPWWQGAQTKSLSNLSKGNPRSRPKPLSRHNKSKLRWSNLLCHFQSSEEDCEIKHLKEDWAEEKSVWKTFPIREMPQTRCQTEIFSLSSSKIHTNDPWRSPPYLPHLIGIRNTRTWLTYTLETRKWNWEVARSPNPLGSYI
jgi:hypothetical protein